MEIAVKVFFDTCAVSHLVHNGSIVVLGFLESFFVRNLDDVSPHHENGSVAILFWELTYPTLVFNHPVNWLESEIMLISLDLFCDVFFHEFLIKLWSYLGKVGLVDIIHPKHFCSWVFGIFTLLWLWQIFILLESYCLSCFFVFYVRQRQIHGKRFLSFEDRNGLSTFSILISHPCFFSVFILLVVEWEHLAGC